MGSSLLTSFPSMALTYLPFSIAPPLTFPLLPFLLPISTPGRSFRTWVLISYQFLYLSLSPVFRPNERPHPSIFRKIAGLTLTVTVLLQRNTRLFLFSLLLLSLSLWYCMQPNLPFFLTASNATLKPGGLLRWKKRLVKDARLSLPLTEVMKIARLTSPLLNVPRQSSPRLRHGRRLAFFFHPNLTLNVYALFFALSLALLPRLPPLLTSLTVFLPGSRLWSMALT